MANPQIQVEISAVIDGLRKGFGESVKIIETLENQARDLEKALNEATDLDTIGRLNQDLAKTRNALSQLRTTGVEPLTKATSQYNAVGVDFARIIQDAPFGIIGVGNNITQLAGSFQQLKNSSTSTGAALKTALSSIIAPTNLLVLGVSALTTVLTLYSQGAFGATKEVESLDQAQKDFNDTLQETDKLVRAEFYTQILRDLGILEIQVTETGKVIKDVFSDRTAEERLQLLGDRIRTATKPELEALAKFLKENLQGSFRSAANATTTLEKQIAQADITTYTTQLDLVNKQLDFYKDGTDKATKATKDLQQSIITFSTNPLVDAYFEAIRVGAQFEASINKAASALKGTEGDKAFGFGDFKSVDVDTSGFTPTDIIPDFDDSRATQFLSSLTNFRNQVSEILSNGVANTIGDFAFSIGEALGNGTSVVKAAGAALLGGLAGVLNQLGQLAIGTGIAIGGIKKALQTLNPVAAIAGGVALIALAGFVSSKARSLSGNFVGGGGSSIGTSGVGGGSGSAFAGGAVGGIFDQNREFNLVSVVRGNDIVLVSERAMDRVNKG
jgi:exonuclease VII small subunit